MARFFILISAFFILYFLVLFQTGFLAGFNIAWRLNLVFLAIIIFNLLEKTQNKSGLILTLTAGFFLDIFSEKFWGFWMLVLLISALFIKYILKKFIGLGFKSSRKSKWQTFLVK